MYSKKKMAAWCVYDWANSAFATVILTFVFSVYFGRGVVGDETLGASYWSYAVAVSAIFIAVLGPLTGAIADGTKRLKRALILLTCLCAGFTAMLWFATPTGGLGVILFVLGMLVLANVTFELSLVIYNSMLGAIAPPSSWGRMSGWAWGLGYMGGLVCLVIVLLGLVGLGETPPFLSLPQENSEHVRASALLVAGWIIVFSLPMFLLFKDPPKQAKVKTKKSLVKAGFADLWQTLKSLRAHPHLLRFLIASAFYRDGLNTLFAVGGLYAAGVYGMSFQDILIFAIGLNVTAGLGAFLFSFVDDRIGSKRTILIALVALFCFGASTLIVDDKDIFMILALCLGLFIGPAQAASRTLAVRLSPPEMAGQTFGLYAFTGKSVSFLGPLCFGLVTAAFDNLRAGMVVILFFWVVGGLIIWSVKEKRAETI